MRLIHPVLVLLTLFAVGSVVGYVSVPSTAVVVKSPRTAVPSGDFPADRTMEPDSGEPARGGVQQSTAKIEVDGKGNYLVPAALVSRLALSPLDGLEPDRDQLALIGLDEEQVRLLDDSLKTIFGTCFEREKAVAMDFTRSAEERVLKIPGDPEGAEARKQQAIDAIRLVAGSRGSLLEERLMPELEDMTMQFGAADYFLRVSPSKTSEGMLVFESIQIFSAPGDAPLEPGTSFVDFRERFRYGSSRNYSRHEPPDYLRHLLEDGTWKELLKKTP